MTLIFHRGDSCQVKKIMLGEELSGNRGLLDPVTEMSIGNQQPLAMINWWYAF